MTAPGRAFGGNHRAARPASATATDLPSARRTLAEEDDFALTRAEALAQVMLIEVQIGEFGAARHTLRAFVELFNSEAGRNLRVRASALEDYPEFLLRALRFGDVQCPAAAAAIVVDRPEAEAAIAYFR